MMELAPLLRLPCCGFSRQEAVLWNSHVSSRGEGKPRLGGELDVLFAGRRCPRRSGSRSGCRPDSCSFAATSERANRRASGGSPANKPSVPLALAFLASSGGAGGEGVSFALHGHAQEMKVQFRGR